MILRSNFMNIRTLKLSCTKPLQQNAYRKALITRVRKYHINRVENIENF